MLAKRSTYGRLLAAVAIVWCLVAATAGPVAAQKAPQDPLPYVKYYVVVAEYEGKPDNLTDIAARLLGSGERSAEIYNLNAGRVQPDGESLADPAKLNAGWYLVLPWDAVGDGVKYGQIPTGRPKSPSPSSKPKPRPGPDSKPNPGASGSPKPSPSGARGNGGKAGDCATTSSSSGRSDWAQLRLAAEGAWDLSRGNGVVVAVVDSGVDGTLEQLSGRVAVGADVTVGSGRGDVDCLGTGTAMASIIAANASTSKTPVGIAPDATILPVRMVGDGANGRPMDAANAIEVAVSAGASVIALGSYVDLAAPAVLRSLTTALNHDVLVVAGAPTTPVTLPTPTEPAATGALLLAGGVGADNSLVENYQPNTVEVIAPAVEVASIGPGDAGTLSYTGTRFAVAFVAGQAALIRAAYPELTAVQVERRIHETADVLGTESPDGRYGFGMINPGASVAQSTGAGQPPADSQNGGAGRVALPVFIGIALIAGGAVVMVLRFRRRAR